MKIKGTDIDIPESLVVDGDLNLWNSGEGELPAGLEVGGYLDLYGSRVAVLPPGLTVGGSLYLLGSNVCALPVGLSVGGYLDVRGTKVRELPDDLQVGDLYADDGQLIASEAIQLGLIKKDKTALRVFKYPTDSSRRLHDRMWKI